MSNRLTLARLLPAVLVPAVIIAAAAAPATAADVAVELPIVEHELDNGLRVLVHEDHDIPNVALYVVWKVGSRNEVPGITGLAHYFEHMMFMGGARYGARFDPVMEAAGGSNNAYTSRDVTVYQDWFPAAKLPLILEMEADRMSGMVFTPQNVESERGVVASEHRLSFDDPTEVLREQLWASAFTAHPYRWDVLGWFTDVMAWKQTDLERFFATHYKPNNATLIVVGDVKAADVFRLVETTMGDIARGPERRPIRTQEPEQRGERRVTVIEPSASLGQVMMAWHMPATVDPEFPIYEVLEQLLLSGQSSRLHRLLIDDERACLAVSGGWQGYQFDPSLFTVELTMRERVETRRGEALVYGSLADLAAKGPPPRELQKAKNQLRAGLVREMRTINGKASLIADTDTFFGGWRNLPARAANISAVTVDDIKRVLTERFLVRNRTVATLLLKEPTAEQEGK